jgi:hypothetical protein
MRFFLLICCALLLSTCTKPVQKNNEIIKVELAESGYFFDFGKKLSTVISIDSCLNFRYYDGNKGNGYYIGKVSLQFWDTINRKLDMINFKTLKSDKPIHDPGKGYYELIVHWKAGKRRIIRTASLGNNLIDRTFTWLNYSCKKIKLRHVNSRIKFETTFQDSVGFPSIKDIRFPPPIKD